jgi:hypothetical protein
MFPLSPNLSRTDHFSKENCFIKNDGPDSGGASAQSARMPERDAATFPASKTQQVTPVDWHLTVHAIYNKNSFLN